MRDIVPASNPDLKRWFQQCIEAICKELLPCVMAFLPAYMQSAEMKFMVVWKKAGGNS